MLSAAVFFVIDILTSMCFRIRAQFGQDILHNAVHGCSTQEEAISKIQKIFGPLDFASDGTVKGRDIVLHAG